MYNLRDGLTRLLRVRTITILFTLSTFLLPILTVLIFVLNFHIKQSLKTQFSDNRHIIHTRETLPLGAPYAEAKFKFEPDFFNIERSNAVALVALFTSAMAVDAFIIARGNQGARRDVVDKILHEPRPDSPPTIMVWAILQVFLQCLPLGGLSWLGERGFKRCKYSHSDHDLQVAKCPVESAACAVLPYFQIQRWWVGSVCWETRIVRYSMVTMFLCSAVLLRVYGPQELRLRKTMRYYFWETEETKNLLKMDAEANVPLEEKVVENKQAETGKS